MNHLDLSTLVLKAGGHESPEAGMCVNEAVAFYAHEAHTDRPKCMSPVIASFTMSWNDGSGWARKALVAYIPRLVGTNTGKADDEKRAWLATDWLARECAPAFLRAAGLTEHAEALESLAPVLSPQSAKDCQPKLAAAGAAAWDAAGDAAWDAAWDAAGDAAWDAARDAAGDAAWDAARAAAWDAARAAAGAAKNLREAADKALAPVVEQLQVSALGLLDRMIGVGQPAPATEEVS